jgi:hypothetical protein
VDWTAEALLDQLWEQPRVVDVRVGEQHGFEPGRVEQEVAVAEDRFLP